MADLSAAAPAAQGPIALLLEHRQTAILTIAILLLAYFLYNAAYGTDIPHIRGIPEPSGAVPFYGHIKAMGDDHPSALENWSVRNAWPLLQAKLGNRRIIVLNTFEAAQHFIQKNASATIDRPIFWTFHKMVSNTQGTSAVHFPNLEERIQDAAIADPQPQAPRSARRRGTRRASASAPQSGHS